MKEIRNRDHVKAKVRMPGSKSITHRALVAAGLAGGRSVLSNPLVCDDTRFTAAGLRELGVETSLRQGDAVVKGIGGRFTASNGRRKDLYLGDSGTSYRLLLSVAALGRGAFLFACGEGMKRRPVKGLLRALEKMGAAVSFHGRDGFPPVVIQAGGLRGGKVEIAGHESSQFLSSLLLAAPYADRGMEIRVTGRLVSRHYVDMTIHVMNRFGVQVEREGHTEFRVPPGQAYRARHLNIEGDVSAASYFWAAASLTRGVVVTENIHPFKTVQGDILVLDILEEMGARVDREAERVTVKGGDLRAVEVDMGDIPDMVPTVAVLAVFARGTSVIRNVSHLRMKESDRLHSMALELNRLGCRVEIMPDGLVIHGGTGPGSGIVDPHDDHRIAMAMAVAGLCAPGVAIRRESCVGKSFPGFWDMWDVL